MNKDQVKYYAKRAKEYEEVYEKPERQKDLATITFIVPKYFYNKTVLEVACGTGFWTKPISSSARSLFATDINNEVLEIAKTKSYKCPVDFELLDLYALKKIKTEFEGCFGGFIWSHIPKQKLKTIIRKISTKVAKEGVVVFIDNQYVEGNSTPIYEVDEHGNSYQLRELSDGSKHKVLKNYPTDDEIYEIIGSLGEEIEIIRLQYYWIVTFKKS